MKNPQREALDKLFKKHGGLVAAARYLSENLGEEFTAQDLSNWRARGVSIKNIFRVASAFGVSPELLNREAVIEMTGEALKWNELMKQVS